MKLCAVLLLTIFGSSLPLFGEEVPTPTPSVAAALATPSTIAGPALASGASEPTTASNGSAVQLYSLDYNEDLDLFYASGTQTTYTGAVYSNYENGKKELAGALKDGQRDGHWTEYYEDGKMASTGDYRGGKEVGPWKYWFENGTLQSEGSYSDASPVGKWTTYYENGKLESEGIYVAGEMDGPWKLYDDTTGEVRTVNFKDGEQLPSP